MQKILESVVTQNNAFTISVYWNDEKVKVMISMEVTILESRSSLTFTLEDEGNKNQSGNLLESPVVLCLETEDRRRLDDAAQEERQHRPQVDVAVGGAEGRPRYHPRHPEQHVQARGVRYQPQGQQAQGGARPKPKPTTYPSQSGRHGGVQGVLLTDF